MKNITSLAIIFCLLMSQSTFAQQVCKDYITDEWPDSRYTVADILGDNVVTDNNTGLMWKQCTQGLSEGDCMTGALGGYTWKGALDLAINEDFAGFTDWRVPNQKELRTIVARNCLSPSINASVFPNTPNNWFWSSSPVAFSDSSAWIVLFSVGIDGRGSSFRVGLVRSLGQ